MLSGITWLSFHLGCPLNQEQGSNKTVRGPHQSHREGEGTVAGYLEGEPANSLTVPPGVQKVAQYLPGPLERSIFTI